MNRMRTLWSFILVCTLVSAAQAQLLKYPSGAGRLDVSWYDIRSDHFIITYHSGLDSVAHQAASIAEAVYPVVTRNLGTRVPGRTRIYLSNLDEVPDAFAYGEEFIYVWMRGINDDMPLGGIRAAGRAKWLRSVITHEFTHIAVAHATDSWYNTLTDRIRFVPRWFSEGVARTMEPDGWTPDLDVVMRMATSDERLGTEPVRLGIADDHRVYESGHSIVLYMIWRFGADVIPDILHEGFEGVLGYDFGRGVERATGYSLDRILSDWKRTVNALYGAEYAARVETSTIAPGVDAGLEVVYGAAYSPDRHQLAMLAVEEEGEDPQQLYLVPVDPADPARPTSDPIVLSSDHGFDPNFTWSPDGHHLVIAKQARDGHQSLVYDLFVVDVPTGDLHRITRSGSLHDPFWAPDGHTIVAVQKKLGHDNLVAVDAATGSIRPLRTMPRDVQIYTPCVSADGTRIAFSVFGANGRRTIAIVDSGGGSLQRFDQLTNARYPLFSPDGRRVVFTTYASGVPDLQMMSADGTNRHPITAVAGGLYSVQWLPGSDSVVAISFDAPTRITPHLIPANDRMAPPTDLDIRAQYSAWQHAHFPLHVPDDDAITAAKTTPREHYNSLTALFPIVPVWPMYGADMTSGGGDSGYRLGLNSVWSDPMGMHSLIAYGDYGLSSGIFGGELGYVNNMLPVMLIAHGDYSFGERRTIDGQPYFQRNKGISVRAVYTLNSPVRLDERHVFSVEFRRRLLEPANLRAFGDVIDVRTPVAAQLSEVGARYMFNTSGFLFGIDYLRGEPALGSSRRYDRVEGVVSGKMALPWKYFSIIGGLRGEAGWGQILPQEFIGLDRDDLSNGSLLGDITKLTDPFRRQSTMRVRGYLNNKYGDMAMVATLGVQTKFWLLEDYVPLLKTLDFHWVTFADLGSAWHYGETPSWVVGIGTEARQEVIPNVWINYGLAVSPESNFKLDPYVRMTVMK